MIKKKITFNNENQAIPLAHSLSQAGYGVTNIGKTQLLISVDSQEKFDQLNFANNPSVVSIVDA